MRNGDQSQSFKSIRGPMMKHASNRHFFANALAHIGLALALLTPSFSQDEPFVF